ncbi:MAG: hypothetical protein ACK5YW_09930 [Betaproteobacteria bacterium]|jgi:hypothetical protein|nr:hypothetical protein [Rhodocyclaceae bacterium]MCA3134925.1 hypothetical protein [Rhodocyclaceae bacterium]MCA3141329.1 hypothetical protein [Rhodocyclaceae bacterium]MCA3147392.1 hypothetical protein [Rhodocyclaceae bacterium]MCE2897512.1 hypothetical protein [Betaproteobacteria bacterium]
MSYRFEQRGRRPMVAVAMALGMGFTVLGLTHDAPWYFTTVAALPTLMALMHFARNSHSGLMLEADTLTLFKDRWRHVIHVGTIRSVRVTQWSEGQGDIWLDLEDKPPYRIPGYCFGSAAELADAFCKRGIAVR